MVRENRIKEFKFFGFAGSQFSSTSTGTFTGDYPINGEILEVAWRYGVGAGSMFITESGTGKTLWSRLAASGNGIQYAYPNALQQIATGSLAGGGMTPFVVNNNLILNTGSILSGATTVFCNVKYR